MDTHKTVEQEMNEATEAFEAWRLERRTNPRAPLPDACLPRITQIACSLHGYSVFSGTLIRHRAEDGDKRGMSLGEIMASRLKALPGVHGAQWVAARRRRDRPPPTRRKPCA